MRRVLGGLPAWIGLGAVGWAGVLWLGLSLWNQAPPRAGFDLALLLDGARAVLRGETPYDPGMLAGIPPSATDLFYSYPPVVAQAMTPLAWLPNGVVLVLWALGATAALGHIAAEVARRAGWGEPASTLAGLRAILAAPLVLPFAVALLFGNLDAWYPLAYGALVLTVVGRPGRATVVGAGVAVALVTLAKLHPAGLLLWVAARAIAERGGPQARVLASAAAVGIGAVALSLLVGGAGPWLDYLAVVRAGTGAELVDPRNIGPVSLLGQATALEPGTLRAVQAVVSIGAAAVTVLAAWRIRDGLASVTVASAATLVLLPVTWYHYPVALMPVAIALVVLRPRTRPLVALSALVAGLAIAVTPLLWVAVALVVLAAFRSDAAGQEADAVRR